MFTRIRAHKSLLKEKETCNNVLRWCVPLDNIFSTPTERDSYFIGFSFKNKNKIETRCSPTHVCIPYILQVKRETDKCAVLLGI